ncbi:transmembrane protein 87A isoform X2 [Hyalella azteca]|uniref:Transmembrane protein 87A isoform X2 n=1 Tax=Hyalella azteca TaxID=294128 RepID=A0A8B7N7J1_HYAAZ|nr:transmembrane protein 87A isoform X2 [Hyalella azteca]
MLIMSKDSNFFTIFIISVLFHFGELAWGYPEQGKWSLPVSQEEQYIAVTKSMFNGTSVLVKVKCDADMETSASPVNVTISWVLRWTPCWKEYLFYSEENKKFFEDLFESPELPLNHEVIQYPAGLKSSQFSFKCDNNIILPPADESNVRILEYHSSDGSTEATPTTNNTQKLKRLTGSDAHEGLALPAPGSKTARTTRPLVTVHSDGVYLFMMRIKSDNGSFTATVDLQMVGSYGYLSASDYPLLWFYSVLCVVYVIYGVVWLVLCFLRWRDLLRLQYWIAAVILLGLLEKAMFVAEYESLNEQGYSVPGLLIAAEIVSCAKRTISRILVVIVALGFGIVKPRLGSLLHRVIALGMLYFLLASIESCTRILRPKTDQSKQMLVAVIPLALLDSLICWWVFSALVSTIRTLRLRRNPTKLALYSYFTNALALGVLLSVIFMFWSVRYHTYDDCLKDWQTLWLNDAFWHLLFALLLLVIMILWRPTNNNQRFAFSPLLDDGSDGEEIDHLIGGGLAEDTKHRSRAASTTSSSPRSSRQHSAEDDLKWVEDNIPSSFADMNLSALDSDEEIMTTRFEMSKMQ